MVLVINYVLHWFLGEWRTRSTPIAYFGDVMQSEAPGGYQPESRRTYCVNGQNSSAVLELKQERSSRSRLKPSAVVIGRVVIANRGMEPAGRHIQVIVVGILDKITFDIYAESVDLTSSYSVNVVRSSFEDNLTEEFEFFRDIRRDEQVELSQGEGGRVAFSGVTVKSDIAEAPEAQESLAKGHSLRHRAFCLLLSFADGRCTLLSGPGCWTHDGRRPPLRPHVPDSGLQLINSLQ